MSEVAEKVEILRQVSVTDHVIFVDPLGKRRNALITAVWGEPYRQGNEEDGPIYYPSVNLVIVTTDDAMSDTYGRQITRTTSVVHKGGQQAHGNYWLFPDE